MIIYSLDIKQQSTTTHKQSTTMTSLSTQFNALVIAVKAEMGSQVMPALRAFLNAEGIECSAEMMGRLEAVMGKIVVNPTKETVGGKGKGKGKGKAVKTAKTPDMSDRCQGCDWKGGKIQNAWCKKEGEHSFMVGGETVKCCAKHFTAWEKVSDDPHHQKGVGYAVSPAGNGRVDGVAFLGFFGVSATNPARRIPVFPGEHYATLAGVGKDALTGDDKPAPSWVDKAMDLASEAPEIKNGRKKGVYMPSGGWEGAAESVKLDNDTYKLTSKSDTTGDLTEDTEQVDETREQTDDSPKQTDDSPKQTDDSPKQTDDSPKQTDDAPKQTDDAPKQTDNGKRKSVEYRGEEIHLTSDQSGNVYVSKEIVKWVKEDEQVNNPDFKGLLAKVKKSWGKYNKTSNSIEWNDGAYQEAVDTFMDMGDDSDADDSDGF